MVSAKGRRAAIVAGLRATDPAPEIVIVLDFDPAWAEDVLAELLLPFSDPQVGGVTPRQAMFAPGDNPVRRLADWIEDIRSTTTRTCI